MKKSDNVLIQRLARVGAQALQGVSAEALIELQDSIVRQFCNKKARWDRRKEALDGLYRVWPDLLAQLKREKRLRTVPMPDSEEWAELNSNARAVTSCLVDPAQIETILESGKSGEQVVVAAELAESLCRYEPARARRIEPLLRQRIADRHPAIIGSVEIYVGLAAQRAHASVLGAALQSEGHEPGRPVPDWALDALSEAIRASLDLGPGRLENQIDLWCRLRLGSPKALGQLFLESLADSRLPPVARLSAFSALDVIEKIYRKYGAGSFGPEDAEAHAQLVAKADELLMQSLRDPAQSEALHQKILAELNNLKPDTIETLRRAGILPSIEVPQFFKLKYQYEEEFKTISRQVRLDEVVSLLGAPPGVDLERVLTAIELVAPILSWFPEAGHRFEAPLRKLISEPRVVRSPYAYGSQIEKKIDEKALSAYAKFLDTLRNYYRNDPSRTAPWSAEFIRDAIERALDRSLRVASLVYSARPICPPGVIGKWLLAYLGDRSKPGLGRAHCREAVATLGETALLAKADDMIISILRNQREDETLRAEAQKMLVTIRPSAVQELQDEGAIRAVPVPNVEEFYYAEYDERNNPIGFSLNSARVAEAADVADAREVLRLLEKPDDSARALAALHLVSRILQREPSLSDRIGAALLDLIADSRVYESMIKNSKASFEIGSKALFAYLGLVKMKKPEERGAPLIECLRRALKSSDPKSLSGTFVYSLRDSLSSNEEFEVVARRVAEILVEAISDRARPSSQRIAAYEAIGKGIDRGLAKEFFEQTRRRAAAALVSALEDRNEDEQLREYVRKNLDSIDPEAISRLQEKAVIPLADIPPVDELLDSYWGARQDKLREAALRVTPEQVTGALFGAFKGKDLPRMLAAMYLAPPVAKRGEWRTIADSLLYLISSRDYHEFKIDERVQRIDVCKVAADQLLLVLRDRLESDSSTVVEFLFKGLDQILDLGLSDSSAIGPVLDYVNTLSSFGDEIKQKLRESLLHCLRSRQRSSEARYLAYRYCREKEAEKYALEALLDSEEEPGFRALLGTTIPSRQPEALKHFVDVDQKPWRLLAGAPTDLPVIEPHDEVPDAWIVATIAAASDRHTRQRAIQLLRSRLSIWTEEDVARVHGTFRALVADGPGRVQEGLRAAADDESPRNSARPAAAGLLALLGEVQDEERIARCTIAAGWTKIKPLSSDKSPTDVMLSVRDSKNAVDSIWSLLDPYIRAGYGDPKADRIIGKALVLLAQKHLEEGRTEYALKAYRWALDIDGDNLDARRGLKKLGG